jgi:hypothetical protein
MRRHPSGLPRFEFLGSGAEEAHRSAASMEKVSSAAGEELAKSGRYIVIDASKG